MWRLRRDESGQAAEAVIIFPLVLLFILGVVQAGVYYHASAVAKAAVSEGLRTARAEGASGDDGARAARDFLSQVAPTIVENIEVDVRRDFNMARVELRGTAAIVIPGLRLPIHALAESQVERFRSSTEET